MKENLKKDFSVELWIVGDGPDKKIYQDYIIKNKLEENVKLLGMQKNPFPYMKEADYILLTSEYEGFPVTYMEAAVLNKKIVTTIDVSDQFIKIPKKLGFIISKDTKKMQKQIKDIILDNKFIYDRFHPISFSLLHHGRRIVEKEFESDKTGCRQGRGGNYPCF